MRAAAFALAVTWLFLTLSFVVLMLAYRDLRTVENYMVENRRVSTTLNRQLAEQAKILKELRADRSVDEARYLKIAGQLQTVYTIVTAEHHQK